MSFDALAGDANRNRDVPRCYRLGRFYLVLGVVFTALFFAVDVISTSAAYWNIDGSFPRPRLAALISGVFWTCWTFLGLSLILAFFRERLYLTEKIITQRGLFVTKFINVADAIRVIWRRRPQGGSVVLLTRNTKVKIYLGNFTRREREELISFVQQRFPTHIQEGFEEFKGGPQRASPNNERHVLMARIFSTLLLLCFAGIFSYCWIVGLGSRYLVIAILNVLVAVGYLAYLQHCRVMLRKLRHTGSLKAGA